MRRRKYWRTLELYQAKNYLFKEYQCVLHTRKKKGYFLLASLVFERMTYVYHNFLILPIFNGFNSSPSRETRGIFLDKSKAFDKVWHKGLLFKLKTYGIQGQLLKLIKTFLTDMLQRFVLSGQSSDWKSILAGVHQGSILGPLFFLIFINDLHDGLQSIVKIFADDTSLFSPINNPIFCSNILNNDLVRISEWACQWKMSFNPDPKKQAVEVCFTQRQKTHYYQT